VAFGGAECKADGKTVNINTPETARMVDYRRQLFKDGETEDVLSWTTPATTGVLAEAVSVTGNAASIYWRSRRTPAPARRDRPRAVAAGAGRPLRLLHRHQLGDLPVLQVPEGSQGVHQLAARPKQYSAWMGIGEGMTAGLLNYYEDDPVWKKDPKLEVVRQIPRYVRMPGYPGPPTRYAAESMSSM